ncbi:MAG: hypothetical protein ACRDNF_13740 [Streptosporangiaceae bacterium]
MSQPVPGAGNKPGVYQRAKNKIAERAAPLVLAALGPSERILVGVRVESGLSRWWVLLSTYASFLRKCYRPEIESMLGQLGTFGLGPGQPYGPPPGQQNYGQQN